eukprot:c28788_g1_i1 orf=410-2890(-)
MEVRPLPQQRHPLMHTPPIRPPQQQQMAVPHPQPALVPSFSQSQQQSPAHLLQPMQPLQQLQSMQQQQAHYGIAPRPSSLTGSMTPGNLAPPLIGQKRESSGFSHAPSQAADSSDGGNIAKLFVGCLPRNITEDEVQRIFAEYGNVLELAMIRERRPGIQHGICFIKYGSVEEAERAIRALHNKRTLPGGTSPLQVRFADAERERPGAMEQKLFVGSLSKLATEKDIEEIFAPYGRVDDVYIMRDEHKQSRGCAFVKYPSRDMAVAAISALNSVYKMLGCDQPITVRFADPKRPRSGDTRVGGPGFGVPHLNPQSGQGSIVPRPSTMPGGHVGARNPYWHPAGSLGMGPLSQGGLRPYGASSAVQALSEGFPTVVTPSASEVSGAISGSPHTAGVVSPQVGGPGMLAALSQQQGYNQQLFPRQTYGQFQQMAQTQPQVRQLQMQPLSQPLSQSQSQSQLQLQTQPQQQQQLLPAAIHQQHPQGQLQPLQAYSQIQSIDSTTLHQAPYGQLPSAQVSVQQYGQMAISQQQAQQQMPFSAHQTIPTVHVQQSQVQPVQQHFPYSIQQLHSVQPIQSYQYQQQLQASQPLQQHALPIQSVSAQFQTTQQHQLNMFQQPLQHPQAQPLQHPQAQSLQSSQAAQQAFFQVALPSPQQQISTQPSWTLPQSLQAAPSVGITVTPVASTPAPPVATCNWTEHTSPEGHKYYYNSITGESRWEKPEEFAAYEHQQQQNQPQPQPQPQIQAQVQSQAHAQIQVQAQAQQQQVDQQQQYVSSTTMAQRPVQGMAYGHSQSSGELVDPSRSAQRIPSAQQPLPTVQDWMWKMKPAGL